MTVTATIRLKIGNRQLLSAGNAKTMIRSMEIIT